MAKKISVEIVDDLDGTAIGEGGGLTVGFAFDGNSYEIDLTNQNAAAFRSAVEPYLKNARLVTASTRKKTSPGASQRGTPAAHIRAWAIANGHDLAPKGRIPAPIREAYETAHR